MTDSLRPTATALERAFDIARSGRVSSMAELRQTLKAENYALTQLSGPSLARQLTALMRDANRGAPDGDATPKEDS
jgi:hypothetical protein